MKVKDVMLVNYPNVHKGMTLKKAASLFTKKGMSSLPVVDEKGKVLGVLMREDLIQLFVPEELSLLRGMPPGRREPQSLFEREADYLHVEDIMRKAKKTIPPTMGVLQAAVKMQREGLEVLPVVQQKKLLGLLTYTQLCKAFFEK